MIVVLPLFVCTWGRWYFLHKMQRCLISYRVVSKQSASLAFIGKTLTPAGGQVVGSYSSSMKMRRCARSFSHTCICICNCVGNFYLSARGAGGRKRRCARSFSRTRLLRDSLISTDFRVSSGNYCCSTWYNIYR